MPRFSIIVPVYNVLPYLSECINSVLQQSYHDFELILVNDGSTDSSGAVCDAFALQDERIKVIHKANGGLSDARNAGIARASGEYVLFLDSDDFWSGSHILDLLAARTALTDPDVLSFNYVKFDDSGISAPYFSAKTMPLQTEDPLGYFVSHGIWIACAWNKLIKRTLFADGGLSFVTGIISEDMDWCVRLALKTKRMDYIDDVVICYRQRSSSISHSRSTKTCSTVLSNIRCCISLLEHADTSKAALLKPYIAYQYGTLLFHLARLEQGPEKINCITQAHELQYLLKWSDSPQIKLLNVVASFFGLHITLFLLKCKGR